MSDIFTFIVVDDHPMVRRGLTMTLHDEPDFRVVAEAASGYEAMALVTLHRPDFVILDINMPGSGLEASKQIKAAEPGVRTVMFSFKDDLAIVRASEEAGASAYIVKGVSGTLLLSALRQVMSGTKFIFVSNET